MRCNNWVILWHSRKRAHSVARSDQDRPTLYPRASRCTGHVRIEVKAGLEYGDGEEPQAYPEFEVITSCDECDGAPYHDAFPRTEDDVSKILTAYAAMLPDHLRGHHP